MIERTDLHAFVDGQLSSDEAASIGAALAHSPADAREVEAIRNLKALLAEKTEAPDVAQSWKNCVKRIDEVQKSRRVETIVGRYAPAFCAVLFVVILLVGRFSAPGNHSVSSPDLARLVGGLSPVTKPDFDTDHWAKELLRNANNSTPDHLAVRGISRGSIDGAPVTCYSVRDQNGNLLILKVLRSIDLEGLEPMTGTNLKVGRLNGMNMVARTDADKTIIIVADRTYADLAAVAAQVTVR